MPESAPSNIHFRRRWFYALWTGILLIAAMGWIWLEQPAQGGDAKLDIVLNLRGMPENGRASLWVGRTTDFQKWAAMPMKGEPVQGAKVSFSRPVHLAFRRLGQGYMLRHTDDCFVLTIEAGGQRRYLIYDLREDIQLKFLRVGKKLTLTFDMGWHSLWREVKFPEPSERIYLGW